MRLYALMIIALAVLAFFAFSQGFKKATPEREGVRFVTDLIRGNLSKIVRNFGGNTCRCPAKGGWGSYLVYQSGQEPNLAFLVGHPVLCGDPSIRILTHEKPSG